MASVNTTHISVFFKSIREKNTKIIELTDGNSDVLQVLQLLHVLQVAKGSFEMRKSKKNEKIKEKF